MKYKGFNLLPTSYIDMGSVQKEVQMLNVGESIITYNVDTQTFELSEILSISESEQEYNYYALKINNLYESFSDSSLIYVKNKEGKILLGYFSEPNIEYEGTMVEIIPSQHEYFNGTNWVTIEKIDSFFRTGKLFKIKVKNNGTFFIESILTSDINE